MVQEKDIRMYTGKNKTKTAAEMFAELGYEEKIDQYCIRYIKPETYTSVFRKFNRNHEVLFCFRDGDYTAYTFSCINETIEPLFVDLKLHKAINKQLEELGWL